MSKSELVAAYEKGQVATAISIGRRLLEQDPGDEVAKLYLGMALKDTSQYEEAGALLASLLGTSDPGRRASVLFQLALLEDQRGDLPAAEVHLRGCIELKPEDAAPRVVLGSVLARAGRLEEAEGLHREATECTEGPVDEAWLNLGLVLRGLRRLDEAEFSLRKALRLDPDSVLAREALDDVRGPHQEGRGSEGVLE